MVRRYAVFGSGRQGTAAAYDVARFGSPESIILVDANMAQAQSAADRVRNLCPNAPAVSRVLDVTDDKMAERFLEEEQIDILISGLPYALNLAASRTAIPLGVSMVDMGGNTEIAREQLALDREARATGATLVPDCGMGPGMNVSLLAYGVAQIEDPEHAYVYEAGLPIKPEPPWNYSLTFNIAGLTNEYTGKATFLQDGEIVSVDALEGAEEIEIPELGVLEARVTTGGLSTAPWSYQGILRTLENKTLRYPGHWDRILAFRDLGLLDVTPVEVDGSEIVPRHVFHALFEPQVVKDEIRDVAVIHIRVEGRRGGIPAEVRVDLVDLYDEETQFTAMERVTGWHTSIMAQLVASGEIPPGAHSVESAVSPERIVEEARRRGLSIRLTDE